MTPCFHITPGRHQQQCRNNIVAILGNKVESCFDSVAENGNNVEAAVAFVEATFDFVAFDDVASTSLVCTGLNGANGSE